jgi:hypothetical protein
MLLSFPLIQGFGICEGYNNTINLLTNEELKKYYFCYITFLFILLVMLNIKTDINFSNQHKTNMKVNANSLLYTTFDTTITLVVRANSKTNWNKLQL